YNKKCSYNSTWYLKECSRDEDMANIIKKNYSNKKGKWFFIAHLGHTGYKITYDNSVPAGSLLKKELKKKYFCIGLVNKRNSQSNINTLKHSSDMADAFLEV
ncbi:erythromycin esterase family protein, partial [Patescibacteria group bacterium]